MNTTLMIILIIVLIGVVPVWPHSTAWGYGPTGAVTLLLIVLLVLALVGRL